MKREVPLPPESPAIPPNLRQKSKRGLMIAVILITILLGVALSTYFIADSNLSAASSQFTVTVGNTRVTGVTLSPPSIDMEVDYAIGNPSDINFHLNRLQADIFIEYGTAIYTVGSIDVSDKALPARGYTSATATLHVSPDVLELIVLHPQGYDVVFSGTASLTGTWLFWTVTKQDTKTLRNAGWETTMTYLYTMYTLGYLATMIGGGGAGQEKVAIVSVSGDGATDVVIINAKSTGGGTVQISDAVLKDSAGTTLGVVTLTTAVELPADGTTKPISVTFSGLLTSDTYYTVTLVTKLGNSFVSPTFKAS